MADQLIEQRLIAMYQERLCSLPSFLEFLSQQILSDELLKMEDPHGDLSKYKIDRLAELVKQILTGQKQRLLVRALSKVALLQQSQQAPSHKSEQQAIQQKYERKLLQSKIQQVEQLNRQLRLIKQHIKQKQQQQQHQQKQQQNPSSSQQIKILQQMNTQLLSKYNRLQQQRQHKQQSYKNEMTAKLKYFIEQLEQKQQKLTQVQEENDRLKAVIRQNPVESNALRSEKIACLKRQITVLTSSLHHLHHNFTILRDTTLSECVSSVGALKIQLLKLKQYILTIIKDIIKSITVREKSKIQIRERVERRVRDIDDQIQYFMENHLVS